MKLQSHTSRIYKGKEYQKHWVVISNKDVDKLGWKTGNELAVKIKDKKLIIERE